MLLMTQVEIEYIVDPTMYSFMFDNVRGGVSTINHRWAKANNPYLADYDENLPTSYIMYLVSLSAHFTYSKHLVHIVFLKRFLTLLFPRILTICTV